MTTPNPWREKISSLCNRFDWPETSEHVSEIRGLLQDTAESEYARGRAEQQLVVAAADNLYRAIGDAKITGEAKKNCVADISNAMVRFHNARKFPELSQSSAPKKIGIDDVWPTDDHFTDWIASPKRKVLVDEIQKHVALRLSELQSAQDDGG